MAKTYRCKNAHVFTEGTPAYEKMLTFAPNARLRFPCFCPEDQAPLHPQEEALLVGPATQYAVLVFVADVSASMWEDGISGDEPQKKIDQVVESIAHVFRALALPAANTANSLLIGILAFASRAMWVRPVRPVELSESPIVVTASDFVRSMLPPEIPVGSKQSLEIPALIASLTEMFETASTICGRSGTNYEAAVQGCDRLLKAIDNEQQRKSLKTDWDEVYRDSGGRRFVRTFFYSDGAPNPSAGDDANLTASCRAVFATDDAPLITALFSGAAGAGAERAQRILNEMCSLCPDHRSERCSFSGMDAAKFRRIIRMASGGAGFCPRCLQERA